MPAIAPLPSSSFEKADFLANVEDGDLLFFLLNVGDGDTQLLVLPKKDDRRRAIVVDVRNQEKLSALVVELMDRGKISGALPRLPLLVATHPHDDHIAGVADFLGLHDHEIDELWDPGFLGGAAFHEMMVAVHELDVTRRRPTSGYVSVIDDVRITVLSPSVRLKQQFATHHIAENNASLTMRVEFPASRVRSVDGALELVDLERTSSLLLGADAQTEAWAHAAVDFPRTPRSHTVRRRAVAALVVPDVLRAQVLKVPHHGSKRGVSFELAERVNAEVAVVSCTNGNGNHDFPHDLARGILRDFRGGAPFGTGPDSDLGIHYTGATAQDGLPLGTICVRINRGLREVWRFRDDVHDGVDLSQSVRMRA